MEPDDSLEQVAGLLRLLPGLTVDQMWLSEEFAHFSVLVESADSLGRLVQHMILCNADIEVELAGPPCEYGETAPAIQYRLRLTHDKDSTCTPSQLEILGVFLARDLKALGLIEASRADELQRHWNAVVR